MGSAFLPLLAALCTGIAVGSLALYLLQTVSSMELEQKNTARIKRLPLLFRLLLPFTALTRRMANADFCKVWRSTAEAKLWMAGLGEDLAAADFVAIRLFAMLLALVLLFLGSLSGQLLVPLLIAVLISIYPQVKLNTLVKARQLSIMKALPNVLDLLTLSVESGRDFLSALRDILDHRRSDPLGEELSRTFQEIQFGRKRSEALRALSLRVRQPDLTATVNALIQAEELGVSIAQQLKIQSDMQRNKRFALAEKLANEASVKIIIPVVLFILPAVFIILLGPLLLQTMKLFQ